MILKEAQQTRGDGFGRSIRKSLENAMHKKKAVTQHERNRELQIKHDRNSIAQLQKKINTESHKKKPNKKTIDVANKEIKKAKEDLTRISA